MFIRLGGTMSCFENDRLYDEMIDDPKFMDFMESIFRKIFYVPEHMFLATFNQWLGAITLDTLYECWLSYNKMKKRKRKK